MKQPLIDFDSEDAFDYDADTFTQLQAAYQENRRDDLTRLYAELRQQPREYLDALDQL